MKNNLMQRIFVLFLSAVMVLISMPIEVFASVLDSESNLGKTSDTESEEAEAWTGEQSFESDADAPVLSDASEEAVELSEDEQEAQLWSEMFSEELLQSSDDFVLPDEFAHTFEATVGEVVIAKNGFRLQLNEDRKSYCIVGYVGSSASPEIPDSYNGIPVTRIGDSVFFNNRFIRSIVIPDSIVSIGIDAFTGCNTGIFEEYDGGYYLSGANNKYYYFVSPSASNKETVTEFTLHEDTRIVAAYAFRGCTRLEKLTVPGDNVVQMGYGMLMDCNKLASLTIPYIGEKTDGEYNTHLGYIFGSRTYGGHISYIPEALKELVVNGGMPAKYSLFGVDMVESLTLPNIAGGYLSYVFGGSSYEDNIVPKTVKNLTVTGGSIGKNAFYNCISLLNVKITEGVSSLDSYAFKGCVYIETVDVADSVEMTVGDSAFENFSCLKSITIPSTVVSIGDNAFYGCSDLTSVHITDIDAWCKIHFANYCANPLYYANNLYLNGELVTDVVIPKEFSRINNYTFYNCLALKNVTFEEGSQCTSIGDYAFGDCYSLTSITIPSGVTSIGECAFSGCSSLTSVNITDIDAWCKINFASAYSNPLYYAKNLYLNGELVTDVVIPKEVTSINYTFYNCRTLKNVTFEEGSQCMKIGNCAFSGCSSLTEITIPSGVTSIGEYAFYGCSSLTEITIPSGVTSIGGYAFYGCSSLTEITIPSVVTSIGSSAFEDCSRLTSITIPSGVTSIGARTFYDCSSLTGITIPSGVTSIGKEAFRVCRRLTVINIPLSVDYIGEYAFRDCSQLTIYCEATKPGSGWNSNWNYSKCPVVWGSSVQLSGDNEDENICETSGDEENLTGSDTVLFSSSEGLRFTQKEDGTYEVKGIGTCKDTNIVIPEMYNGSLVTSIGNSAFLNCSILTEITIPSGVTIIGYGAFGYCSSLTSVTFEAGSQCTSIGDRAFDCSSLTSITIPSGVTSIGECAFCACSSLTSVTFEAGSQCTSIGDRAFSGCISLTDITIPSGVTSIGSYSFSSCRSLTGITIPSGVTSIGEETFGGCIGLTSVNFEAGSQCTSIGSYAFGDCISLTKITIPSGVTSIGYEAFTGCSSLTSITIPSGVTSIGEYAFSGCSSLTSVTFEAGSQCTSIGDRAFYGCSRLRKIVNRSSLRLSFRNTGNGYVSWFANLIINADNSVTIKDKSYTVATDADGFVFRTKDNAAELIAYTGGQTAVTLPKSYNGKPYTLYEAFLPGVESIAIPENSLSEISAYAFYGNTALKTVTIPNSVRRIGSFAFCGSSFLERIVFEGEVNEWRFIRKASDWDEMCGEYTVDCKPNSGILYESDNAFESFYVSGYTGSINPQIKSEYASGTVIGILSNAFMGNQFITGFEIPETVVYIGNNAFKNCTRLETVNIPSTIKSLGFGTFSGCNRLTEITLPFIGRGLDDAEYGYIGYIFGAYSEKENGSSLPTSLKKITITQAVSVPDSAFAGCAYLTDIVLPDCITSIGNRAFANCSSLQSFSFPAEVSYVGTMPLYNCTNLRTIGINSKLYLEGMQDYLDGNPLFGIDKSRSMLTSYEVASNHSQLSSDEYGVLYMKLNVILPNGDGQKEEAEVSVIDAPAKANLTGYVLPTHIVEICPYAFAYNEVLTSIDLEYVRMIGSHAFFGAPGLVDVRLGEPDRLQYHEDFAADIEAAGLDKKKYSQYIDTAAFMGCQNLRYVNLETDMIKYIGQSAFADCTLLKEVTIGRNVCEIGLQAFSITDSGVASNLQAFYIYGGEPSKYYAAIDGVLYAVNRDSSGEPDGTLTLCMYPACKPVFVDGGIVYEDGSPVYLKDFSVPENVSAIESFAFKGTQYLESLEVDTQNRIIIGDYAFSGCRLGYVYLGKNVSSLGVRQGEGEYTVFADCPNLTTIDVDWENANYRSEDGVLFDKNHTTLIKYPEGKAEKTYVVPDTVTAIASMAFKNNLTIELVTIVSPVSRVGLEAFYNCPALNMINFKNVYAPTVIMENAFTSRPSVSDGDVFANIGYSVGYYEDGYNGEYGWKNLSDLYPICEYSHNVTDFIERKEDNVYAIVVLNSEGEKVTNAIVSLYDPYGESETVYTDGTGVATFYDLYGETGMGFAVDYDGEYSVTVYDDIGEYYMYRNPAIYLDSETHITYITVSRRPSEVILNTNGGTGDVSGFTATKNVPVSLPNDRFEREGYTLCGWSSSPDGEVEYTDTFLFTEYQDTFILYAIWEAHLNTIKYDANTGNGTMSDSTVYTDSTVELSKNTFTLADNTFIGWSMQPGVQPVAYFDGASILCDAAFLNDGQQEYTLYAQWRKTGILIYHPNGGKGTMADEPIYEGEEHLIAESSFEREGYSFDGWKDLSGNTYSADEKEAYYTVTGDNAHVLYAQWKPNEIELDFYSKYGKGDGHTVKVDADSMYWVPTGVYTRSGYELIGWSLTDGGPVVFEEGVLTKAPLKSATYYAVWAKAAEAFGVSCGETDISTRTVELNKAQYGYVYDDIKLKDKKIGYVENNIVYSGQRSETVSVTVIGYCVSARGWSFDSDNCGLYQNGVKICSVASKQTEGDSTLFTFELPVKELANETEIEARLKAINEDEELVCSSALNIHVFDFSLSSEDVNLKSDSLEVDLGKGGAILAQLLDGKKKSFNLTKNVLIGAEIDGSNVILSFAAKKQKSSSSSKTIDYEKGYFRAEGARAHNRNTYIYQFKAPVTDKDGKIHFLTYNLRFSKDDQQDNYYYYSCYIYEGTKYRNTVQRFFGAVNSPEALKRGRCGIAAKASLVFACHYAYAAKAALGCKTVDFVKSLAAKIGTEAQYKESVANKYIHNTKNDFNILLSGELVFRYDRETFLKPVSGNIKGELTYTFKHNSQFVVWCIPIVLEVRVDVNGSVELKLSADSWRSISFDEIQMKLGLDISAKAGVGCSVISLGVYGSIGTLLIIDFYPNVGVNDWSIYGELGVYAKILWWEKKKTLVSFDADIMSEGSGNLSEGMDLSSVFLMDGYLMTEPEKLAENSKLVAIGSDIYKIYVKNALMTGSADYDENNFYKIAVASWDAEKMSWREIGLIDDNGFNDMSYTATVDGDSIVILYAQKTDKITFNETAETNNPNLSDECSDIAIKCVTVNKDGIEKAEKVFRDDYYKYLLEAASVGNRTVVVWAENVDNNAFGVSPYNYIDSTSDSQVFATTANSVWVSIFDGQTWSTPECIKSGLSAVTGISVDANGNIAFLVDENGDLADTEDRVMYVASLETLEAVPVNDTSLGSIKNVQVYDGSIAYYYDAVDGESGLYEYLFSDHDDNLLLMPYSELSENFACVYDENGDVSGVVYVNNITWKNGEKTVSGSALYGRFADDGVFGEPVMLDVFAPENEVYISSLGCVNSSSDELIFTIDKCDGDGVYLGSETAVYRLGSKLVLNNYEIDYKDKKIVFNVTNVGTSDDSILISVNGARKECLIEEIVSGETLVCEYSLAELEKGAELALCDYSGNCVENIILDVYSYSDLVLYSRQLVIGAENALLVAATNQGSELNNGIVVVRKGAYNKDTSDLEKIDDILKIEELEIGQYKPVYVEVNSNTEQIYIGKVQLAPGEYSYVELPIDSFMNEEEGVITLYVLPEVESLEKGTAMDNNYTYHSYKHSIGTAEALKEYEMSDLVLSSELESLAFEYDSENGSNVLVRVATHENNRVNCVMDANGTMLTSAQYGIDETDDTIILYNDYLASLAPDSYLFTAVFEDGTEKAFAVNIPKYFSVTWMNADDSVIYSESVKKGHIASFNGEVPEKTSKIETVYEFAGWDRTFDGKADLLCAVESDITYKAVFNELPRQYTVTWAMRNGDNEEFQAIETYDYGELPSYEGMILTPENSKFLSWDKSITTVTGDTVYNAVYISAQEARLIVNNVEYNSSNEKVTAEITVNIGSLKSAVVVFASYDAEGGYENMTTSNLKDGIQNVTLNLAVKADEAEHKIKIFVWEKLETLKPAVPAYEDVVFAGSSSLNTVTSRD